MHDAATKEEINAPGNERLKELITRELSAFLLSERQKPLGIDVTVSYPQATAHLHIDAQQIADAINGLCMN